LRDVPVSEVRLRRPHKNIQPQAFEVKSHWWIWLKIIFDIFSWYVIVRHLMTKQLFFLNNVLL
jgi:hypothetical protein